MNETDYLTQLQWRYATKKFDNTKKVSKEDLEKLLDVIQLSASSYGLQPYQVHVVENKEVREKLHAAGYEQPQILDATYVLVFSACTQLDEAYLDAYIANIMKTRNMSKEDLAGMKEMIMNTVISQPEKVKTEWAKRQAYIALGNLLSAAAFYEIDVCPMEGFENEKFDELLGLQDKNLTSAVIATIGYRHADDGLQHAKKVRKPKEELFTRI